MSKKIKLSHYYTTGGTFPTADNLINGEIAISMKDNSEKIYMKNNSGNIVSISTDNQNINTFLPKSGGTVGTLTVSSGLSVGSNTVLNGTIELRRKALNITADGIITLIAPFVISGNASINQDLTVSGTVTSMGGFYDTSDENLKNFGENIKINFEKLKKLRKSYFTFKNDVDNKMHIGVSAQEIKTVFPEIINEDKNGYLTVDYSKLSIIAIAAIDELNNKYKKLEKRLQKIEKKLDCE